MAETNKSDGHAPSAADAVRELVDRFPIPGRDIIWFGDQLIAIAQHVGSFTLELVRDGEDSWSLVCCSDPPPENPVRYTGRGPRSYFRPLMARIAVMCSDETGTEFKPYGGHYTLRRAAAGYPVQLDIDFSNTTACQRLTITRTPLSREPEPYFVTVRAEE